MAQKNGQEGIFIPQSLAQWMADYMTVNSIPKVPWADLNNAITALIECSKGKSAAPPKPDSEPKPNEEG